jgi:SH3-like domain-containing protein
VKRALAAALVAALATASAMGAATGAFGRDRDRPTPSGLPVPRWVSLKFDEVNVRSGPGDDYDVVWVYHARRLPVQIVEETRDWRKVCDPDGGSAWVRKSALDGKRTLFRAKAGDLDLRKRPKPDAPLAAKLRAKSIVDFDRADGGWRRVKVDGVAGWAPASELWGGVEAPQCK